MTTLLQCSLGPFSSTPDGRAEGSNARITWFDVQSRGEEESVDRFTNPLQGTSSKNSISL